MRFSTLLLNRTWARLIRRSIRNSSSPSEKADKPDWQLCRADLTRSDHQSDSCWINRNVASSTQSPPLGTGMVYVRCHGDSWVNCRRTTGCYVEHVSVGAG
ncbi:hypothetical protein AOLI_G00058060 [Acnodon oligacanthus]